MKPYGEGVYGTLGGMLDDEGIDIDIIPTGPPDVGPYIEIGVGAAGML